MPDAEDQRFETRLRQFHPLPAEPLLVRRESRARRRMYILLAALSTAAVTLLVVGLFKIRQGRDFAPARQSILRQAATEPLWSHRPLTIGTANRLLHEAPSYKWALNKLAVPPETALRLRGTQSALSVLGKEDFRP
jgi:hypothetical protein